MRIQPFQIGPYGTMCYAVYEGNRCVLIDAPFPLSKALSFIKDSGLNLEAIYLTHGHFDHIFGLAEARKAYKALPIYIGEEDLSFITGGYERTIELLKAFDPLFLNRYASPLIGEMPDDFITYGSTVPWFSVIKTPGHTSGSVSLYSEKEGIVFTGDTLFYQSVGRTDLDGNQKELLESLKKLSKLDPETLVFPGHGGATKIGTETKFNPYFRF